VKHRWFKNESRWAYNQLDGPLWLSRGSPIWAQDMLYKCLSFSAE